MVDLNSSKYNFNESKSNYPKNFRLSNDLLYINRKSNYIQRRNLIKNEIYKNYKLYEFNLNNFFDVFYYLDLLKDIKFLKEILFEKNENLFNLLKYKIEPLKKDSNERLSLLNVKNIEENTNTIIIENLKKILYQQFHY